MAQSEALVIVLSDEKKLEALLKTFLANGVRGCTILESEGMTHHVLDEDSDPQHFSALRTMLNTHNGKSRTLLLVASLPEIQKIVKMSLEVLGDISKPDTAFMMTFPVDSVFGLNKIG
jgi:ureidoglycolate hydrolase